jgi:peptidoglycan/LPS O-acetylase OafA/YrhL
VASPERTPARNPWAIASLVLALVPFGVFAAIVVAAFAAGPSDSLDRVFYLSVPLFGALAVVAGLAGRRRPEQRTLRRIGIAVGALEVLATAVIVVALVNALRTLG